MPGPGFEVATSQGNAVELGQPLRAGTSMRSDNVIRFRSPWGGHDRAHVRSTPLPIICVGRDPGILRLRLNFIQLHSDLAVRSLTPEEADRWIHRPEPHVWVFCYTVELPRLVYLACRILRFSPESRLTLIEGAHRIGFESTLFHLVIRRADGTDAFLEGLIHLATAA
jgi:hypothetical protein